MSEDKKTFRVTVPFHETVCGREFYIVEAESAEQAVEVVKSGEAYVDDMVTDGALDDFRPYFDEADVEEW
jgi:hypothetical protein